MPQPQLLLGGPAKPWRPAGGPTVGPQAGVPGRLLVPQAPPTTSPLLKSEMFTRRPSEMTRQEPSKSFQLHRDPDPAPRAGLCACSLALPTPGVSARGLWGAPPVHFHCCPQTPSWGHSHCRPGGCLPASIGLIGLHSDLLGYCRKGRPGRRCKLPKPHTCRGYSHRSWACMGFMGAHRNPQSQLEG